MSQAGAIIFYRTAPADDPPGRLRAVLDVARPPFLLSVSRTLEEGRVWDSIVRDPDGEGELTPYEIVESAPRLDPSRMPGHYRDGRSLSAEFPLSPLVPRMARAIQEGMPEAVHGWCLPDSLFVTIGFHDLFDVTPDDEALYVARPFLAFRFWRQCVPTDWREFRARIFNLPGVVAVRRDLEAVTGPLEGYALWQF